MADITAVFILTEEHWGTESSDFRRLGIYGTRELAERAAREVSKIINKTESDPENYSYFLEEDRIIFGPVVSPANLVADPGRAWRWWPQFSGAFEEVEQAV